MLQHQQEAGHTGQGGEEGHRAHTIHTRRLCADQVTNKQTINNNTKNIYIRQIKTCNKQTNKNMKQKIKEANSGCRSCSHVSIVAHGHEG